MTLPLKHPLAFGATREPIRLPPEAFGWRVRFVPQGSLASGRGGVPEVVNGPDGSPLYLRSTDALGELHKAVARDGLYRLDAVDEALAVLDVEPAYAEVSRAAKGALTVEGILLGLALGAAGAVVGGALVKTFGLPKPLPPLPRAQDLPPKPVTRVAFVEPPRQISPKRR